ncbi:6421_t:CDS:2, partial [Entrophospora sp. SA101]
SKNIKHKDKADDEFDKIERFEDSLVHIEDEESSSRPHNVK